MSNESPFGKARPLFIVKPKTMSRTDIRRAEKLTGICVVECDDPASVRLLEPPIDAEIGLQARAALKIFRMMVNGGQHNTVTYNKSDVMRWFLDMLIAGSPIPEPPRVPPVKK